MPAWDAIVALWVRLCDLSDAEAVRIAATLPEPDRTWVSSPASVARNWVSQAIWRAAHNADSPSRLVLWGARAGGSWYEDIIDPSWRRIEVAAETLADGLADGTATLEQEGAAFGPWPSRYRAVPGSAYGLRTDPDLATGPAGRSSDRG